MKIAISHNAAKPSATAMRRRLCEKIAALGLRLCEGNGADVVVSLGGDGTLLRTVHEFPDTPVLGLNLGGLGYLASVGRRDFNRAFELLAAGRYSISRRTMLEARAGGRVTATALNDIVVAREASGHTISLDLTADGKPVTRYLADGLIVATPTGSTAYSLAAGGPVIMPDSGCVVVTPSNPHALGARPLVVRDSVRLLVAARPRTAGNGDATVGVFADGEHVCAISPGEAVQIVKSRRTAKLVELEGYDQYDVLARKLGWSGCSPTPLRAKADGRHRP